MPPLHVRLRHSLTVAAVNRGVVEAFDMKDVAGGDVDDGDFGAPFLGGGRKGSRGAAAMAASGGGLRVWSGGA